MIKNLLRAWDPYRQSFLYFRWGFWGLLFCAAGAWFLYGQAHGVLGKLLFDNIFVYLPNYLTHEFSHRFWCTFGWEWWCYASGNCMETLVVLLLCFGALRLSGGRYLLPPLLYWLSTTLYGAGIYCADARAMKLHLTSSDMMSNFAPGMMKGDWHYILSPLGLLEQDVLLGNILVFAACVCFMLAAYSLWYYWTHSDQYLFDGR